MTTADIYALPLSQVCEDIRGFKHLGLAKAHLWPGASASDVEKWHSLNDTAREQTLKAYFLAEAMKAFPAGAYVFDFHCEPMRLPGAGRGGAVGEASRSALQYLVFGNVYARCAGKVRD